MEGTREDINCAGFTFIRNFDSANLAKVELVPYEISVATTTPSHTSNRAAPVLEFPDLEFNIWTTPDCGGTEFENGNRTWFYFGMKSNAPTSMLLKLNVVDINKQSKMYSQGMCPVYKVIPSRMSWERIREKPTYLSEGEVFTLSFKYRTPENPQSVTFFAFTYPFSYNDLQKMLYNIDSKFLNACPEHNDDIYYTREPVCNSMDGKRIDLLTISSYRGISNEREPRLKNLFVDESVPRPNKFPSKKVIFISARVHPGETPSSFVFNGLLHLLLNRDDQIALALRRLYVFKMIPFLNPDGVSRGHYRTDSRGVNLNRVYLNPSISHHPSIYAARNLIRYYHYGYEKPDVTLVCPECADLPTDSSFTDEDVRTGNVISDQVSSMSLEEKNNMSWCLKWKNMCTNCGAPLKNSSSDESVDNNDAGTVGGHGDISPSDSGIFMYMDFHGHASKKGIFMYGNHFDSVEQNVECMLLPKLMSLNNHNFHFTSCNFTERNMYIKDKRDGMSRAGSGRVAISALTGIVKSYTLECNYNTGRLVNVLPPTVKERMQRGHTLPMPPKYSPSVFEEVGRSLGASILDLTNHNPLTRVPHSEFHSLNGVVDWLRNNCVQEYGESTPSTKVKAKSAANLQAQGGSRRVLNRRRSSPMKSLNKIFSKIKAPVVPTDRKENMSTEALKLQPSCSNKISRPKSGLRIPKGTTHRATSKLDISLRSKNSNGSDKTKAQHRKKHKAKTPGSRKLSRDLTSKSRIAATNTTKPQNDLSSFDANCELIKVAPSVPSELELYEQKLLYAWNASLSSPNMLDKNHMSFLSKSMLSEPGSSNQESFSLNTFSKSAYFSKNKKHALRRLGSAHESIGKIEKYKKKKRIVKKV